MGRTQIYLGEQEVELLARVEQETGASRSELIRRAIRTSYGAATTQDRVAALRRTSGAWRARRTSGAEFVAASRTNLDERLRRLGM